MRIQMFLAQFENEYYSTDIFKLISFVADPHHAVETEY